MKRTLFESISVIPYTSGDAIDREGFLSAIIAANAASGATVTVKVEHSDDGETFVPAADELVFPESKTTGGVFTFKAPTITAEAVVASEGGSEAPATSGKDSDTSSAGSVVNIDVDLLGLKNIVKFTVTGASDLAVVLGDGTAQPA